MEKKIIIVCLIVGFFGGLAACLGFVAETQRIKQNQMRYAPPHQCIYPRSPAVALGLTASMALVIAQTIINVATGCLCCARRTYHFNLRQTGALVCAIFSWFTFLVAILVLLMGAALNDARTEESAFLNNYYCYGVKSGIFTIGATMTLATVILGILSYMMFEWGEDIGDPCAQSATPEQPAIAMARPQFPQQRSQDPVFVPEDTYMRRQLALA